MRERLARPRSRPAIVPSLLDADFASLAAEVADLERSGADGLHWDVMDGHFVPRITHGPDAIRAVRPKTDLPFEAHLMIDRPEEHWRAFVDAGVDVVIVHAETSRHLHLLLSDIRAAGCAAGLALNPGTPLAVAAEVVQLLDLLLVMSVNPGRGGQAFIAATLAKVADARRLLDGAGSAAALEVDGGVTRANASELVRRGATALVAGSAIHRHPCGREAGIRELAASGGPSVRLAEAQEVSPVRAW